MLFQETKSCPLRYILRRGHAEKRIRYTNTKLTSTGRKKLLDWTMPDRVAALKNQQTSTGMNDVWTNQKRVRARVCTWEGRNGVTLELRNYLHVTRHDRPYLCTMATWPLRTIRRCWEYSTVDWSSALKSPDDPLGQELRQPPSLAWKRARLLTR